MAVRGCRAKLFLDDVPLSGFVGSFNVSNQANVIAYNVLQNCFTLKIPGIVDGNIAVVGYMNDNSSGSLETKVREALASQDTYITVVMQDSPLVGLSFRGSFVSDSSVDTPIDSLITVNSTWQKINNRTDGLMLADEQSSSATGAITGVEFDDSTTTGGYAVLLVHSITGSATDATIEIESDDNGSFTSAASEGEFTFSAVGVYPLALTGTIDEFLRVNVTSLGGATAINYSVLVGLNGVTQ